jgi:hypothetical protein
MLRAFSVEEQGTGKQETSSASVFSSKAWTQLLDQEHVYSIPLDWKRSQ